MKKIISVLLLALTVAVLSGLCAVSAADSADGKTIALSQSEYKVGEPIVVTATGEGLDWVGLYHDGDKPGDAGSIDWYYVKDHNGEAFAFGVLIPAGNYKAILLANDGYDIITSVDFTVVDVAPMTALVSNPNKPVKTAKAFDKMPRTFEVLLKLAPDYENRPGVIVGNYAGSNAAISFELSAGGQPRLYYSDDAGNVYNHVFTEVDVRSKDPVLLTLVQDPGTKTITCYLDGKEVGKMECAEGFPDEIIPPQEQMIGGDFRDGNAQFFKGLIYEVRLYSDALTAQQVASGTGTGLLASYDFTAEADQNKDLSGSGYDLVGEMEIYDPDWVKEADITDGLTFDALTQYWTTEDGFSKTPYTYSAWVYLPKTHSDRGGVIIGNFQTDSSPCVSIEVHAGGVPRFYHIDFSGTVTDMKFTEADVRGGWTHVAFTVSDNDVVTCYVNGEAVGERAFGEFETFATEINVAVGGDLRSGNAQYFKGRIREVALFENVLTADEVAALYKDGVNAVGGKIVAYYDLTNAKPGKNIKDLSGNGFDLFVEGGEIEDDVPAAMEPVGAGATGLISEAGKPVKTAKALEAMPRTFDVIVQLDPAYGERPGVIVGNYAGSPAAISFELAAGGHPRLYYSDEAGTVYNHVFSEVDMRSEAPVRLTLVQDPASKTITCYLDGKEVGKMDCAEGFPDEIVPAQEQMIGGDFRDGNAQFFKGVIYKVRMYSDALSADQVASATGTGLLTSYDFTAASNRGADLSGGGYDLVGDMSISDPNAEPPTVFELSATGGGKTLFLSKDKYEEGEHIIAAVKGGEGLDWVGIYHESDTPGVESSIDWRYAKDYPGKDIELAPALSVGNYKILLLANDGYDIIASIDFTVVEAVHMEGLVSNPNKPIQMAKPFDKTLRTFEALLKLDPSYANRPGVIVGNYAGGDCCISFELQTGGHPRLYYQDPAKTVYNHIFDGIDVRSDVPVLVTLVQDPVAKTITCYVDGVEAGKMDCAADLPDEVIPEQAQMIGGDYRGGNEQFFKGVIYKINLYTDVLTAEQVASGTGTGLIASYDFTTGSNPNADLSGNGYDLIGEPDIYDPDAIANSEPEIEGGMSFDSATIYMTDEDGFGKTPYTYSAWVYLPKSQVERGGVILGNYQGSVPCVNIEIHTGGVPRFYHTDLSNTTVDLKFTNADIRTGDWAHLAFTVAENEAVTCYVNGEFVGEQAFGEFDTFASELNVVAGGDLRSGNGQYFKGRIREIALFQDVLTADDIAVLYKDGANAVGKKLTALYNFDNVAEGENIADLSGNNYTLYTEPIFLTEKEPVGDYSYSFAFVGDTQILTEYYPDKLPVLYDWILGNKDSKKIQYVFGLGDITNSDTDKEWSAAMAEFSKLDGVIPYSAVRGNHDSVGKYEKNVATDAYKSQFEGFYQDSILNTWRTFKASTD